MGSNEHGELGVKSAGKAAFEPVQFEALAGVNVVQVVAGYRPLFMRP